MAVLVAAGCGRVGFDPLDDPGDPSARLASIDLWVAPEVRLAAPLSPTFDPAVASYACDVGLVLQSIRVSAVPIDPSTTITIDGVPTPSGALSAPIALTLGSNLVTVTGTSSSGGSATYRVDVSRAGQFAQVGYLKASNAGTLDTFGGAVAVSGDTVAFGAYAEDSSTAGVNGDQSDDGQPDSGAVYVFVRTGDTWTQQAYLKASNTDTGSAFGYSVALSGDTLAVGATGEDSNATGIDGNQLDTTAMTSGAVYVFTRSGSTWSQQAYIKASNTEADDQFGYSVALAGDTLAVGAPGEDSSATGVGGNQNDNGGPNAGAVYAFTRVGATWSQQAYIKASNAGSGDVFGSSVTLSADTLAVGAWYEASSATGIGGNQADNSALNCGAVYVLVRTGGLWAQQAYIKASNAEAGDVFGYAVSVSGDRLAASAQRESSSATGIDSNQNDNGAPASGAVYLFERVGTAWSQEAYIKAPNTDADDRYGFSVALSGDTLAVGADFEDSRATGVDGDPLDDAAVDSGAAYLYARGGGGWSFGSYIKASNTDPTDLFGVRVALSGDLLAIAAAGEDSVATGVGGDQSDNANPDSGAGYMFR